MQSFSVKMCLGGGLVCQRHPATVLPVSLDSGCFRSRTPLLQAENVNFIPGAAKAAKKGKAPVKAKWKAEGAATRATVGISSSFAGYTTRPHARLLGVPSLPRVHEALDLAWAKRMIMIDDPLAT